MTMTLIHKKGILTVLFIILSESIMRTNAVKFWSTYQSWSNKYGRGRFASFNDSNGSSTTTKGKFCNSKDTQSDGQCISSVVNTSQKQQQKEKQQYHNQQPSKLHPRQNARVASKSCSTAFYNCCKESSPSCNIHLLDVRGGNIDPAGIITDTISAAATATAAAAAATTTTPTPYNLPLNLWKILFQIFLTTLNVVCWLIPLKSPKISENKLGLSLANAFSGGVFLSLAFGHLIPECVHGFGEGYNEALPYMIVLGGYLLIFFVEKVAFDTGEFMEVVEEQEKKKKGNGNVKNAVVVKEEDGNKSHNNVGRSAVILLGALAVHSILEMTALGLANTFGDSALLTLSIALHQVRF